MDEVETVEFAALRQSIEIHLIDNRVWALTLSVEDVATMLEHFYDGNFDALTIGLENPTRQWHIRKINIAALEVMNLEDVRAGGSTRRPSKKSRS